MGSVVDLEEMVVDSGSHLQKLSRRPDQTLSPAQTQENLVLVQLSERQSFGFVGGAFLSWRLHRLHRASQVVT